MQWTNKYGLVLLLLLFFSYVTEESLAQCYPNQIVTAAYATGGSGAYKKEILWLTWGSTNQTDFPYGQHNQPLGVGSTSYASIDLGGGTYLCVKAEIINIDGDPVNSYSPGNYSGDFLDDLYNIGGIDKQNQLVSGIINREDGKTSTITLKAKANIDGVPVRLSGMVVADAESLNADTENIHSSANGVWSVIEAHKNLGAGQYNIRKLTAPNNKQEIRFEKGNDKNTGAIAFLKFNDDAYLGQDLSVEFTTTLKGGGLTALAIGLLTPTMDLGDAPESYGSPRHILHNLEVTDDGIEVDKTIVNINRNRYNPGSLATSERKYLGSTAPDADTGPMHSIDAKGDDNTGPAAPDEEDAWPEDLRRISYKSIYMPGDKIEAVIEFKKGEVGDHISGWIDFDLNGTFDEEERSTIKITAADIYNANGDGSVTLEWTVPETRIPYNTYVRLRYFDSAEEPDSPTSNVNYGEVEDHRMYILTPTGLNPMLPSKPKLNIN